MEVKNKRKSDTKDENKCEKCENKLFASLLMWHREVHNRPDGGGVV